MHFTRDVLLLCQAFAIASTVAAATSKAGCDSFLTFTLQNQQSNQTLASGSGEGASLNFFNGITSTYHLQSFRGTKCVLHDDQNHVAVLVPALHGDNVSLYKGGQVPSGSTPVSCTTGAGISLVCSAGSNNINDDSTGSWRLLNTTGPGPFTLVDHSN